MCFEIDYEATKKIQRRKSPIIAWKTAGYNDDGQIVSDYDDSFIYPKKGVVKVTEPIANDYDGRRVDYTDQAATAAHSGIYVIEGYPEVDDLKDLGNESSLVVLFLKVDPKDVLGVSSKNNSPGTFVASKVTVVRVIDSKIWDKVILEAYKKIVRT